MTAQDLIHVLRSATVDELAHIRNILRVPDMNYGRHEAGVDMPRDLGSLWNRNEQRVESGKKAPDEYMKSS